MLATGTVFRKLWGATDYGLLELRLESQLWDISKVTSFSQPSLSHLQNGHSVTHFLRLEKVNRK